MSVEIVILSGSRQGERIRIDAVVFHIGDRATDAICFDPTRDAGCRGKRVVFRLEDDGWRVTNSGSAPIILNQDPLTGARSIRSGDVVRLSDEGPDVSFHLVGREPPVTSAPAESPQAANDAPERAAGETPGWVPAFVGAMFAVGALAVGLMVWRWSRPANTDPLPPVVKHLPAASGDDHEPPPTRDEPGDEFGPAKKRDGPVEKPAAAPEGTVSAEKAERPPKAQDVLPQSIFLLGVEHPTTKAVYPHGTACAIHATTLLTSATLAVELQDRLRTGWQVMATLPSDVGALDTAARRVTRIRVHQAFQELQSSPAEQIFFDLALLSVDRSMDQVVALADAEEVGSLEAGQPVTCYGVFHEGERLTRFATPSLQETPVEVFHVMPFPTERDGTNRGAPSLLHLEGEIPGMMFGSPIVTGQGNVVGVYAERADLPPDMEELKLHYAAMVTLAAAWLSREGELQWVTPTPRVQEKPQSEEAE